MILIHEIKIIIFFGMQLSLLLQKQLSLNIISKTLTLKAQRHNTDMPITTHRSVGLLVYVKYCFA
jgi:hypothetical protein